MESLQFNRTIRDSVHGTIRLSNEELNIIQHKLFFRLHQIRQNGLLYYVFPSATHTRFEHSLGVLHIADQTFWSLLRNSSGAEHKGAVASSYASATPGQAIPFHTHVEEEDLLTDLHRITRLAALVHDLGHGPFSHTFDAFAPKAELIAEQIEQNPKLSSIKSLAPFLKNKERVEHEEMSCFFFALICSDLIDGDNLGSGTHFEAEDIPSIVSSIILGNSDLHNNKKIKPYISLLHDLVASAPIDVDRMDYLERDSRSIGVNYGLYDRDRVLKSFLVYKERSTECCRLGIKLSGVRAVENFVQARFELFVQIYYHKTNSAIILMLEQLAKSASEANIEILPASQTNSTEGLITLYTSLSDTRFLRVLQDLDSEYKLKGDGSIEPVVELAKQIADRRLWKRVVEGDALIVENVYEDLLAEVGDSNLAYKKINAQATKGLDKGAALLQRIDEGVYTAGNEAESNWKTESKMINALANEEGSIGRIYFKGEDDNVLSSLRKKARQMVYNIKKRKN